MKAYKQIKYELMTLLTWRYNNKEKEVKIMEKTKCTKCGKEVYITSLKRILEEYKNTLITHNCKRVLSDQQKQ